MKKQIWIKVSPDEYELPEAVADSCGQLARLIGVKVQTIYSAIWRVKHGEMSRSIYEVVEVDDE